MKSPDRKTLLYIAVHAVTGASFGFLLQRFAIGADLQTGLLWGAAFGAGAAVLAYQQSQR